MPPITTAEAAIDAGTTFLNRYYNFYRPVVAKKSEGMWRVVFDVGVITSQKIKLMIDSETGCIVELDELVEE